MPDIKAENVSKSYADDEIALDSVSLIAGTGLITGLVGPDGAGKTTLMKIIAGVLWPDEGDLQVGDIDVLQKPEKIKANIGFMPQGLGAALYDRLSIRENMEFVRDLRGLDESSYQEQIRPLLKLTRLEKFTERRAGQLSGGMRQKLALILSVLHYPDVLLLDEPTTGIDPLSRQEFWSLIARLREDRDLTVLVCTANLEEAERCSEVSLFHEGKIRKRGSPAQLKQELSGQVYRIEYPTGKALPRVKVEQEALDFYRDGHYLRLRKLKDSKFPDTISDYDWQAVDATVEDVMRSVVSRTELPPLPAVNGDKSIGAEINFKQLTKQFGSFTAVNEVSGQLNPGEVYGLLGPNGAGKTTLIKMICCLLEPTSGQVFVDDRNVWEEREWFKRQLGYMSQRFSLYRDLTVRENIELYSGLYEAERDFSEALLERFDLAGYEGTLTADLPGGMRQRLALTTALQHQPRFLVLDEPTSGVDPAAREIFWETIRQTAQERDLTVLVTTHYLSEAEYCDQLGLMHEGDWIGSGSPGEIRAQARRRNGDVLMVRAEQFRDASRLLRQEFSDLTVIGRDIRIRTRQPEETAKEVKVMLSELAGTVQTEPAELLMEEAFIDHIRAHEENNV